MKTPNTLDPITCAQEIPTCFGVFAVTSEEDCTSATTSAEGELLPELPLATAGVHAAKWASYFDRQHQSTTTVPHTHTADHATNIRSGIRMDQDALAEVSNETLIQLDHMLTGEALPISLQLAKEHASKQVGRPLTWAEWISNRSLVPDKPLPPHYTGIDEVHMLNIMQWNLYRAYQYNTDPAIWKRVRDADKTFQEGLRFAVQRMRLSPKLLKQAMATDPTVVMGDPLNYGLMGARGAYLDLSNTITLAHDFTTPTFVHESTHALGGFSNILHGEAYTDFITDEIAHDGTPTTDIQYSYPAEKSIVFNELQLANVRLAEVSDIFAGPDHKQNQDTLEQLYVARTGFPLASISTKAYEQSSAEAAARNYGPEERIYYIGMRAVYMVRQYVDAPEEYQGYINATRTV